MSSVTSRNGIGRREFLTVSASVLAAAAASPAFAVERRSLPTRLAVGFIPMDAIGASFADASLIGGGDGRFISRGARLSVSGANRPTADVRDRRAVELLAHYPYFEGAKLREAEFRAWAADRITGSQGSSVNFFVPVDQTQRISLTIRTERGQTGPASRREALLGGRTEAASLPLTLSLAAKEGNVGLVRGFYAVAPLFEGEDLPRWSAYTLTHTDGRLALRDAAGQPAPFEHFILTVDYAA